jgi:hypothetical protein
MSSSSRCQPLKEALSHNQPPQLGALMQN